MPDRVNTGEYTLLASVPTENGTSDMEKQINVECKQETTQSAPVDTIKLIDQDNLPVISSIMSRTNIFLIFSSFMTALVVVTLIIGLSYKNKVIRKRVMEKRAMEEIEKLARRFRRARGK